MAAVFVGLLVGCPVSAFGDRLEKAEALFIELSFRVRGGLRRSSRVHGKRVQGVKWED